MSLQKKNIIGRIVLMLVSALIGFLLAWMISSFNAIKSGLDICLFFLFFILSLYLQTILHESGHLLFGLLTGYRFVSFRIGPYMWLRQNGKLCFRRFNLAGTSGQCLMAPPEWQNGKIPYILYNLGGCLLNLIVSLLCLLFFFLIPCHVFSLWMLSLIFTGGILALANGIPLRLNTVNNDGYNTFQLHRDPSALRALWLQLKVNEQITQGQSLQDMPDEWFILPSPEEMKRNPLITAVAVLACNRLTHPATLSQAAALIQELLDLDTDMTGLHRLLLTLDQIYCELIQKRPEERVLPPLTPELKNFMKIMKTYPSVLRTQYTYALLADKDPVKAASYKEQFEMAAKKYPYPIEILEERELINYADTQIKEIFQWK